MDFINEMTGQHAGKAGATFAPPLANENHYDLLEVDFGATKAQIREAYVRLKRTYSAQSQALYSVIDEGRSQAGDGGHRRAYHVLQDDHLRRSYDDKLRQRGGARLLARPFPSPRCAGPKAICRAISTSSIVAMPSASNT